MNGKISTAQLFIMLFLLGAFETLSYSPLLGGAVYGSEIYIAILIAFVIRALLIIPAWLMQKNHSPIKHSNLQCFLYIIIFTFFACGDSIKFSHFTTVCPVPDFSVILISLFITAGALYCCLKGREAVFRAGSLIAFIVFISVLLMCLITAVSTEKNAFASVLYNYDGSNIAQDVLCISAESMALPILLTLYNFSDRKKTKNYFWLWNTIITLFALSAVTVTFGTLGMFGSRTVFPVYTAVNAASFGVLKRFDALFICTLALSLVIKLSVAFIIIKQFGKKYSNKILALSSLAVFLSGAFGKSSSAAQILLNPYLRLGAILAFVLVIPLLQLLQRRRIA